MRFLPSALLLAALVLVSCDTTGRPSGEGVRSDYVDYVIHISVDGLRPDAVTNSPPGSLPAFERLREEAAFTDNARTDVDYRITLPNHVHQLTGRPVLGSFGHEWSTNIDPEPGVTIHSNRGSYVASAFDVAHDAGLKTAMYVSKTKFSLFDDSYGPEHGTPDTDGEDNGRDKIDVFEYADDTDELVKRFLRDLAAEPASYSFVHLQDPDSRGHAFGWDLSPGSEYLLAVRRVDLFIGWILDAVEDDPRLADRTIVILTSDHGGQGTGHQPDIPENYIVPFYVWGQGVTPGDLYDFNAATRLEPGRSQIPVNASRQPIRNGDTANLAMDLLGLPDIPGSVVGVADPLRIRN